MSRLPLPAAACLLLALAGPAAADPPRPFAEGSEAFRQILDRCRCEPLPSTPAFRDADPRDTLLIVFGITAVLDDIEQQTGGLARFRERGGALLIASDRNDTGRLVGLGLRIPGGRLLQDRTKGYKGLSECPFVTDCLSSPHPLFRGLRKGIATDLPSHLEPAGEGGDLRVLAHITDVVRHPRAFGDQSSPFLAAGDGGGDGPGRVVVLAGHGSFMNMLMLQRDNDNFLFAFNTVRWLTEDGRRRRVLFVDDGQIQQTFLVMPGQVPPLPLRLPGVQAVDNILHGLEKEDRFNQLLLERAGMGPYIQAGVLGLTLLLLVWGVRRLLLARHVVEPRLPLLGRKVALALAAPPAHLQRREALLRGGNLWEVARDLARESFAAHGVPAGARPPAFAAHGGWWRRRRLAGLVRRLWDLAYGPHPAPVSARGLERARREAEELSTALAAGRVTFEAGPS